MRVLLVGRTTFEMAANLKGVANAHARLRSPATRELGQSMATGGYDVIVLKPHVAEETGRLGRA